MKKFCLFILILSLFMLAGCGSVPGELQGVSNIKKQDIFMQKLDKYYVYFHRVECADCDQSAPYVINYAQILKSVEACKDKRPIYAVLLYTKSEKPNESTYIYREYEGSDGQGTNGKYFVDGVMSWEELYIASTSSLISISTNTSNVKVAKYIAQGAEAVIQALDDQLGTCYE